MSITNGNVNNVSIIDEGGLAVAGAVTVYSNTFICPTRRNFWVGVAVHVKWCSCVYG